MTRIIAGDPAAELSGLRSRLMAWLLNDALPLWWSAGADRQKGGFHEALDHAGRPAGVGQRARVQARQIFTYAVASELQWAGPSRQAMDHGLDYFLGRYRRPDDLFHNALTADGQPHDTAPYLYEQAFALLALATAIGAKGGDATLQAVAQALVGRLLRERRGAAGGYTGFPDQQVYQSDPHMHLLEAAMAWEQVSADPVWRRLADEVAGLGMTRLVTGRGMVLEYFDATWAPAAGLQGRILWPGHQFEWAGLLERWGQARGRDDARLLARRLYRMGSDHGIDPARGVAVMALLDDLSVHDAKARLWIQTEWLKAALILARSESNDEDRRRYTADAVSAAKALLRYLDMPVRGLWRDTLLGDRSWVSEPAPASSFYHVIDALRVLNSWQGWTGCGADPAGERA
jgi:mannose-6-phosphate isomerase